MCGMVYMANANTHAPFIYLVLHLHKKKHKFDKCKLFYLKTSKRISLSSSHAHLLQAGMHLLAWLKM